MDIEIEKLIDDFRAAAIEKSDFAQGRRDGQLYDSMRDSFYRLKNLGKRGDEALLTLLEDDSEHVRMWAGTAMMIDGNHDARSVLETLASGGIGVVRLDAEITLEEFDAGRLTEPFPARRE